MSRCPTCGHSSHRSNDQNAISHVWYQQLAKELPEHDRFEWKAYCKLHFGVPILRTDDPEFRQLYDSVVKHLPYWKKLALMDHFSVTSEMTSEQMSKYLEAMQLNFAGRGVNLEFPA